MRSRSSSLVLGFLAAGCVAGGSPPIDASSCVASSDGDLQGLASQERVDCVIEITGTELETLNALSGLQSASGFILTDNALLRDVTALSALEPFRVFSAQGTPLSADLDLTPAHGDIYLAGSDVESLTGEQVSAAVVSISENHALTSLSFPQLEEVDSLVIDDNPNVAGLLAGFPSLTSAAQLSVQNAARVPVTEIQALAVQAGVPIGGLVHCGNADDEPCDDLQDLDW